MKIFQDYWWVPWYLAGWQMGTDIYTGTALSGLAELLAVLFIYWSIEW